MSDGELAIVLHTHMPYVEGFGTWPFGEEWLWEAVATSYLPLVGLLEGLGPRAGGRLTLSLTPVLCDQLAAPGALGRCLAFLREVRPASHALDREQYAGDRALTAALEASACAYAAAAQRLAVLEAGEGLLAALGRHVSFTSAATHAVLPLLALDAGVRLQLAVGTDAHRRRFGGWAGGLWLPECGYADWLDPLLAEAGVRHACVEFPDGGRSPYATAAGTLLWPLDREVVDLVWGRDGYPSSSGYRADDRRTPRHHRLWSTDGTPYDPDRAAELVARHARHFVAAVQARVRSGGVCVCALDTELLGHWWHEGVDWLAAVLREADRAGLPLTALDEAAAGRHPPTPIGRRGERPSSWGLGRDLRNWSEPPVADLARLARSAELSVLGAPAVSARAVRELLALQSSDWAFMAYRGWAGDYPRQRFTGHLRALADALRGEPLDPWLRHLAPYL
jgi:1,4-alpha-glucan branching enzyme